MMVRVRIDGVATVYRNPHGDAEEIDGSKELDLADGPVAIEIVTD